MNEQFVRAKLEQLETELRPNFPILTKAADSILDQDVSSYPIFIVHQLTVDIGIPLIERADGGAAWSVHASTLEELATKKVIEMSRVDDFRKVYKDPQQFFCLFVFSDLGANFLFLPRPDAEEGGGK
ncbi:hypothetical protein [Phaeodactylibacter luteus]|uniref:Uncharacterized protein n=1 Tax=Phaeodactylibacter luteus TaxID=1564516 RepID=A0A5C6S0W1_9BACT|nr:hypothetical protein [Phaeodactylibacter luteus]TXB68003.1 hypothetical protein FRY97_03915 [Phaeodactylibacter luteus]